MARIAGIDLPKALFVHGFINAPGGVKMSKSLGNSVEPKEILEMYGVDALRYYLLRYIPHDNDGEFGRERFHEVYTSDLVNNFGNLVQRVASMTVKYADGHFDPITEVSTAGTDGLQDAAFDVVLRSIWTKLDALNEAIEREQPWALAKTDLPATIKLLNEWIHGIVAIAVLIQPFMPDTAAKIQRIFDNGRVKLEVGMLFPRLEQESV